MKIRRFVEPAVIILLLLLPLAAAFFAVRRELPELFRTRTFMEKERPVCVLGVSEPSSAAPGGPAGLRNIFINWKTSFPAAAVKTIRDSGAVPMITWEPYLSDIRSDALLARIAAGDFDAYVARFARQSAGGPLFVRFAHEPNSDWYGWAGPRTSPEEYIKAFRRIRDIFRAQGGQARFVFSVNSEDVPAAPWNRFENYYPGDDYADVIGLDAYNWGDGPEAWQRWRSPGRVVSPAYERAVKAFPSKPLFLTETASGPSGGDKARWAAGLLSAVGRRFPAVKAVVWFNYRKETDWTLSSDGLRRAYYGACGTGRIACSGRDLGWLFEEKK